MRASVDYLSPILDELQKPWPQGRTVNIVCHGHSVPAGYFATPYVDTFGAYPHLLHRIIKERFPFAVVNVIVTAIGGENSVRGAERFEADALRHGPDVVTIDYGLNDRAIGLGAARAAWERMIRLAQSGGARVILLTPSWDQSYLARGADWHALLEHAEQIRALADAHGVALADACRRFADSVRSDEDLPALLSHVNHPSRLAHGMIAAELGKFFMAR